MVFSNGEAGEDHHRPDARADQGSGVLGQHLAAIQAHRGEGCQERQRGRGQQCHLDPLADHAVTTVVAERGQATARPGPETVRF
jgi:hypothetical protein